ncbi:MAG TPA: MFS transporter [Candidatus Nitrosotalea sp.]|nr:MFS transporter [Candidatus Nitrosotalea sp.]
MSRSGSAGPSGGIAYKWIALSNTTLGALMAFMNQTIVMIALPTIFAGLHVNPLAKGQTTLLLWVLLGYNVATTVLLVTFGRISDSYGKVRFYNLGFVVFTVGSLLCALTPGVATTGALELVAFRMVQGVGGAFLMANSAAILTDAFPPNQRGLALGVNMVVGIAGGIVGLVLGGLLAAINWRLVFLVSVPVGVIGTLWAYFQLKDSGSSRAHGFDPWGNLTFGLGLLALVVGLTYSLIPFGGQSMGWGNPMVWLLIGAGVILLALFAVIEYRVRSPMFQIRLFKIRAFAAGNLAGFIASLGRGGLQFMLVIWLQGVWLPLHGVSFRDTPLQAGIDTMPMMIGFIGAGPVSGVLSDRFGSRLFAAAGMVVSALGFVLLSLLPPDFSYPPFAASLLVVGAGMGLFAAPNTASIMSSVPAQYRGVASGMRATFVNAGMLMSMAVFFTVVLSGLSVRLPRALETGLSGAGLPSQLVHQVASLPASAALFAALLGYSPLAHLLPPAVLSRLPHAAAARVVSPRFFAGLISAPMADGLRLVFWSGAAMSLVAAVASAIPRERLSAADPKSSGADPRSDTGDAAS